MLTALSFREFLWAGLNSRIKWMRELTFEFFDYPSPSQEMTRGTHESSCQGNDR
jgi:hypothetical protein